MPVENLAFGIIIGFLFICVIVLFSILTIKLYINKVKSYTKMLYEKDLNFQKTLNDTIIETQEQTLNNIAQDLHDDAGQQLTYINFQLENLKLDHPELTETLKPVSNSLKGLSTAIRDVSHSLSNQLLLQQSLVKAIEQETVRLQKNNTIAIHFTLHGTIHKRYSNNETIVIYRIFQEVLNNIFKHSEASQVDIIVTTEPKLKLYISDNGKGFEYEIAKKGNSLGLKNMKQRARAIGYQIYFTAAPNEGTTVELTKLPTHANDTYLSYRRS